MPPKPRRIASITAALTLLVVLASPVWALPLAQWWDWYVYLPQVMSGEPSPTPVPTPLYVPTATAPPAPTGVSLAPHTFTFVDSINYLHVVGEVFNNTDSQIKYVKIVANLFDQGGQLVGTDYTYTLLDNVQAHDRTCFHIIMAQPANWTSYQLEAPTYWTSTSARANLAIVGDSGSFVPTFGWYDVIGQVRNDQGSRVQYVSVVGTVYAADGTTTGCDYSYVSSTHLEAGQTSSFKLQFIGRTYSDVVAYRLQAEGMP